jgi:predicted nucleic acid-binding protein
VRVVLDTSVLVAAIRSQIGASKALVAAALESRLEFLISTPLILEYEAVLTRKEHLLASKLVAEEIREMLDMLCASGIQVRMTQDWTPKLRDPDDESKCSGEWRFNENQQFRVASTTNSS